VSCKTRSNEEFAKIILVSLLKTNKKINLKIHIVVLSNSKSVDTNIDNHEKILTLVGTLITTVADVK
jgi:lipopolysaccharide biosynthesis glycosyltransferase